MSRVIRITDFDEIYEFHIKKCYSEHDSITFRTRLTEQQSKDWEDLSQRVIRADYIDEDKQDSDVQNVFLGKVEDVALSYSSSWYCDITAYSFSKVLDLVTEKKNRIFQDTKKTLSSILRNVCQTYQNIVLKQEGTEISVPEPVIQYQETDWQFLVRITKKYGFDIKIDQDDEVEKEGTLWVGKINRTPKEVTDEMLIKKWYENGDISYKIRATDIFEVGDRILFDGREYEIRTCDFYLKHNAVVREYSFGDFRREENQEVNLQGMMLPATVIGLEGDGKNRGQIQVKFDWEDKEADNPLWIDWATAYSSTDTGIYNMPAIGELVLIHIIDFAGKSLFAESNLRSSKVQSDLKVTDKLLRIGKKEIFLGDEIVRVQNEKAIVLLEEEKVTIQTEKGRWILDSDGVKLDADGNSVIISGGDIGLNGDKVSIACKEMNVEGNNINFKGMVKVT